MRKDSRNITIVTENLKKRSYQEQRIGRLPDQIDCKDNG